MSLSVTHFPRLSVTQKGCWSPSGRLGSDRACEHHERGKGFVHLFLAVWKKIGKLWIFTLDREIGMREAKFSSVVKSLFVTAQRRTFMPEGARHGHFSDYTAFLNIKWCMKMLYPDNRLYFNVKCVLGAHFYSVALSFFCKNSFCKTGQVSSSASEPSLLEQFLSHIKHDCSGMTEMRCGIPSLVSTCHNTLTWV